MVELTVLLINVQNEFTSPGGKLHDKVKDVMEKTGMMTNLPPFVKQMRGIGAKIIYAPIVRSSNADHEHESAMDMCAHGDKDGLFEEGSWNVDFPIELQPEKDDQILSGRSDFSAFHGTELQFIIKWEKVRKLFVAGFLTDVCILETIREAHDLKLMDEGLQIFVLKDCCSAETIKAHGYAVDFSLQQICKIITSRKYLDSLMHAEESDSLIHATESFDQRGAGDAKLGKSFRYEVKTMRRFHQILSYAYKRNDMFAWYSYMRYSLLALFLQFVLGQDYAFEDGVRPACTDGSYVYGGPNFDICNLAKDLEWNYLTLQSLVAFVLGGFIAHTVMLWRIRRENYCQVCGANRNLILQISSLLPAPSSNDDNYEEVKQERETMERWAILGYELAILKAKGKMDSVSGRSHLESLDLLVADEWDKMVAGDRHTTVWYWIQQKAVYLTEQGIISSELRLQTICTAVTEMRAKANDLMSVIDRDNPHAYSFTVGILVNLSLICLALYKGVKWAIWFYDSEGAIYKCITMYADLILTFTIIVCFTMLYDITHALYSPFNERQNTDDVPHRIVASGIRHLAENLGEAKDTRPSTMFWMNSQEEERRRLGLRYKRPRRNKKNICNVSNVNKSQKSFKEYMRFIETPGKRGSVIREGKFNSNHEINMIL